MTLGPGARLLAFDRRHGKRLVAGADEAGRGPLAGPLVAAGVVLDVQRLRGVRARPLRHLNDSKQLGPSAREELYAAILACAERVSVQVVPAGVIDRDGLHVSNLAALRAALVACQPAEVRLVDGFYLGASAPEHEPLVRGDSRSAAIAAASIVAKVTRDRYMHAVHELYPGYGFDAHVGYITARHVAAVERLGPSAIHRRSFRARCYRQAASEDSTAGAEPNVGDDLDECAVEGMAVLVYGVPARARPPRPTQPIT
jgi:ribonuclease HII